MISAHTIVQRVSASIAIFNNALLIVLIVYKSHQKVGKYKYMMIYISVFELFYAVLDGCTAPTIFTKDSALLVSIYANQMLMPAEFLSNFADLFCVFYGISMAIFAVHFIYRYLVVSGKQILRNYDTHVIIGLLSFPLLFGIFWSWVVRCFLSSFDRADEFLSKHHLEEIGVNITDVNYVGPYFWPIGNDGKMHLHWRSVLGILIMILAIVTSFAFILIFGYLCYKETSHFIESASHSSSFNKLQTQLFYALVFQTAIPVVLMHIPASIGFTACFFNVAIEYFGEWTSVTICLYPTLDPLPNFFIIKNYRDAIYQTWLIFRRIVLRYKGSTVHIETGIGSEAPSNFANITPSN